MILFYLTDHFGSSECFVPEYSLFLSSVLSSSDEVITSHGAIEADKDNVRQEPYSLPQGFMWDTLDLGNAEVVSKTLKLNTCVHADCFWVGSEHHEPTPVWSCSSRSCTPC